MNTHSLGFHKEVSTCNMFWDRFLKNPSFKIAGGRAGERAGGRASGRWALGVLQGLPFGYPLFKVICYRYSSMDCIHVW